MCVPIYTLTDHVRNMAMHNALQIYSLEKNPSLQKHLKIGLFKSNKRYGFPNRWTKLLGRPRRWCEDKSSGWNALMKVYLEVYDDDDDDDSA
jgi:hypothetical protein